MSSHNRTKIVKIRLSVYVLFMDNKFGRNLKDLRIQHRLSQVQLAKEIGVEQRQISRYECGINQPPFDIVEKLADYFDVSIDYFFDRASG